MWSIYSIYPTFIKPFILSILNCFKESKQFIFIRLKYQIPYMNQLLDKSTAYISYFTQIFETRKRDKPSREDHNQITYFDDTDEEIIKKQKSIDKSSNEWVDTINRFNSLGSNEKIKNIPTLNLYSEKHNSFRELNKENFSKNSIPSRINLRHQNNSHESLLRESPRTIAFSVIPKYYCGYCNEELVPKNQMVMGFDKTFCSITCRSTFSMKCLKPDQR